MDQIPGVVTVGAATLLPFILLRKSPFKVHFYKLFFYNYENSESFLSKSTKINKIFKKALVAGLMFGTIATTQVYPGLLDTGARRLVEEYRKQTSSKSE